MRTSKAQTRAVWLTFRVENVIVATEVALAQIHEHRVIKLDNT